MTTKKTDQQLITEAIESLLCEGNHPKISFTTHGGKRAFAVHMHVDGQLVGTHEYDHKTGRSTAEVFPEHRGKGYGKLLVLKTLHTAASKGLDFQEDESRTKAYDDVVDSLENAGHVIRHNEHLYLTDAGLEHLNKHTQT